MPGCSCSHNRGRVGKIWGVRLPWPKGNPGELSRLRLHAVGGRDLQAGTPRLLAAPLAAVV
jgi:hypothetical protein